jgi:hypothetical protein
VRSSAPRYRVRRIDGDGQLRIDQNLSRSGRRACFDGFVAAAIQSSEEMTNVALHFQILGRINRNHV